MDLLFWAFVICVINWVSTPLVKFDGRADEFIDDDVVTFPEPSFEKLIDVLIGTTANNADNCDKVKGRNDWYGII